MSIVVPRVGRVEIIGFLVILSLAVASTMTPLGLSASGGLSNPSGTAVYSSNYTKYTVASLWTWTGEASGNVVDLAVDVGEGVIYALSISNGKAVLYKLDYETGRLRGEIEVNVRASYGHARVTPRGVEVILTGNGNNVSILEVDPDSAKAELVQNVSLQDFRVRVVDAVKVGDYIVVVGGKAEMNGSLGFYIAAIKGSERVWEHEWYGGTDGYYLTVSASPDGGVCAAGVGGYACYSINGSRLFSGTLNATVLAIDAPSTRVIILAGVDGGGRGFVTLVRENVIEWNVSLDFTVPSSVAYMDGVIYAAGEALYNGNTAPRHHLAVAAINRKGELLVIGVEEANGTVLIPVIRPITSNTIVIGGSIGGKPFVKELSIEKTESRTQPTTTSSIVQTLTTSQTTPTQGIDMERIMIQYYVSLVLAIVSAALFAVVAYNLCKKRRKIH